MIDLEYVVKQYYDNEKCLQEIADHYKTYVNKIKRILIKNGYKLRDRQEAQSLAIKSGRVAHPTAGKTPSEATRAKISKKISKSWENLTPEEREKRSEIAKELYDKKPIEDKAEMHRLAHKAIRATLKEGSKLEKTLRKFLISRGFAVQFHHRGLVANSKLEVDLYLPNLMLAIEIDGPSHFKPVWGEEALERQKKADMDKFGLLHGAGLYVLRIKLVSKTVSQKVLRDCCEKTLDYIMGTLMRFKEIEI